MMKCICARAGKYICAVRGVRGQSRPYDRLLDRRTAALGGFMNENKVNGNIDGVRQSAIDRLREVYDIQAEGDCFAPPEIIERMAAFTAICNREVSVYISRDGRVMDITVGGPESVPLKSLRLRRNPGRLSMIRCIHTHPEGEARLSGVDRQALRSMNFDAMAAISVRGGKAREIGVGFLGEMGAGGAVEVIEPPCVPVGRIPQEEWMHEIALADGRVRAWSGLESDEERALLISVDSAESLDELAALTDTAGGVVIERVLQRLPKPDPATYIGSGKVEELSLTAQALDIDICIFDDELTGAQIMEAMEYSVMAGGKRLRPMLMQETYRLFGGEGKEIEPFMAAMEMIHTYSLVHDDLPAMDNDEYRRGRKTTHIVYGEAMGILAGDALLNYAFETAVKAFEIAPEKSLLIGKALKILAEKAGIYGMIGGQVVDVASCGMGLDEGMLNFIYELKTGALIESSMMIGALLAGAEDAELEKVQKIASGVGIAFQIQDDILDVTSTTEELGKPVHSDEKNEKTTYVTLKGLEKATRDVEVISQEALELLSGLDRENTYLTQLIQELIHRKK